MSASPYAQALGHRDPVEVMTSTPGKLAVMLHGLTPEQTERHPAPGKWNLREIMCHLADCEIAWAWRLRLIYEKDNPTITPFEQDPWARVYAAYTLEQAQRTFEALRGWNLVFISGLSAGDRHRKALHPERGEITLWSIVEGAAGHDLHHLEALEKLMS